MKKTLVITILIIIIIGVIAGYYLMNNSNNAFDESKAVNINAVNLSIDFLDSCLEVKDVSMENRSERMRGCPETLDENNFTKFKLLESIKGIPSEMNNTSKCNLIYTFGYTETIVMLSYQRFNIYDCGSEEYLVSSVNPGMHDTIYQIKLSDDIINQLKA